MRNLLLAILRFLFPPRSHTLVVHERDDADTEPLPPVRKSIDWRDE